MESQFGFTKMNPNEFQSWLDQLSISRACDRVQQHHTWKPRYDDFDGSNHFALQRSMKNSHINDNGWNDIGQHFTIFPDGVIVTGRGLNTSPACILNANSRAICIEHLGNFDVGGDTLRQAQSNSIFLVTAALLRKIGVQTPNGTNVVYHHWYNSSGGLVYVNTGQKTCPGTAFFGGNQLADFEANFLPPLQAAMGAGGEPPVGLLDWVSVTSETLNIRAGPSTDFDLVDDQGPLTFGAVVRVYETRENGWIRISQNRQLWVYGRLTRRVQRAVVNTADTNARIGPGTQFDVGRVYQPGAQVFVVGSSNGWSEIEGDLWIRTTLLDF